MAEEVQKKTEAKPKVEEKATSVNTSASTGKKFPTWAIILIAIVVVVGGWLISTYNSMVTANEKVNEKWAVVDADLQRRNDLIPNLVATVQGYASHETEVFTAVSDARAKLAGAATPEEAAKADGELSSALSRLLAISEAYPELKSNENFQSLQDELAGTENRIAVSRKDYNGVVKDFNTSVKKFPRNLLAGMFGFGEREYFEAVAGADVAPTVKFE